ncbi:MAG: 50S ribosomal protein L11 methyltransferase [Lachnospiraceae bacterium]|nr:50S ribosomal protein L11 methyltransferase [Lachnospiraceae bacterium]
MKYNRYTVKTIPDAEDIVAATLYELGVEGVEIEDGTPLSESDKAAMFVDILPDELAGTYGFAGQEGDTAFVSFYLDASEDNEILLENIRNALYELREYTEAGELSLSMKELADEDYLNHWKQYFHSFSIGDILFVPSWEEVPKEEIKAGKMIIRTDPGTAFGTGKHETTKLCIEALKKYVKPGDELLDVGTGSGILSLMAYKFGAAGAVGTDLDIAAIDACKQNFSMNGLGEIRLGIGDEAGGTNNNTCYETEEKNGQDFLLLIGNIIDDQAVQERVGYSKYDIVAANILAEVLIPLTPQVVKHIKPGGIYILSGIIDEKEELVVSAVKGAGFEILEVNRLGEWVGVVARYPGQSTAA